MEAGAGTAASAGGAAGAVTYDTKGGGGAGGFGGGGGGGGPINPGGAGGFGGGGGSTLTAPAAAGGFGGGQGGRLFTVTSGGKNLVFNSGGGGGLGGGGDVFIQQGASLVIQTGSLSTGGATGGAGGTGAQSGQGFGGGMFIQGNQSVTLDPAARQTLTIAGVIADQTGAYIAAGLGTPTGTSADGTPNAGAGTLVIDGAGTVTLGAVNAFVGGISLDAGVLGLAVAGAAGSGAISFGGTNGATVQFGPAAAPNGTAFETFGTGDTIAVTGFTATGSSESSSTLTLDGSGGPIALDLPGLADDLTLIVATSGGTTEVTAAQIQAGFTITDAADLAADIKLIDQGGSDGYQEVGYSFTFDLSGTTVATLTQQLDAINLDAGSSLTIVGNGDTVDGGGTYNGLFVYAGTVSVENLTIANARAVGGSGGSGGDDSGGGGAGLGGGLFVGPGGNVTLTDVAFTGDAAVGGAGGASAGSATSTRGGGGGGLDGGAGGAPTPGAFGGGGGIGLGAVGGSGSKGAGGAGIVQDGSAGGAGLNGESQPGGAGGASGGGGGGGAVEAGHGGLSGSSGYGGGGGAGRTGGLSGAFGGGGGGGHSVGGVGGFGGGGGGASGGVGGKGGFGGGFGVSDGAGGGGLGAGGDIFVAQGGSLTIGGTSSLGAGTVVGGTGGFGAEGGFFFGNGVFLQASESLTLDPAAGQTLTIAGVIADQTGSGGTGLNAGAGSLVVGAIGTGTVLLQAANTYFGGSTLASGTLEIAAGGSAGSGAIGFAGTTTLKLDENFTGSGSYANTLANLQPGDRLDLAHLFYDAGHSFPSPATSTALVVQGLSGIIETLDLQTPASTNFGASSDGQGGTLITVDPLCFCAGTRIATPGGAVAVEDLRQGDDVLTADGRAMPVRWLGVQTVSTSFADPLRALPIRIRAGALGLNLPGRDLLLSPGHAVLLDGMLVHAGALVNGTSIIRATDMPELFHYFHVELDSHALLLAEGVLAESFLDGMEALPFDNAAGRGDRVVLDELPYPRVKSYRQVPRHLRVCLAARVSRQASALLAA